MCIGPCVQGRRFRGLRGWPVATMCSSPPRSGTLSRLVQCLGARQVIAVDRLLLHASSGDEAAVAASHDEQPAGGLATRRSRSSATHSVGRSQRRRLLPGAKSGLLASASGYSRKARGASPRGRRGCRRASSIGSRAPASGGSVWRLRGLGAYVEVGVVVAWFILFGRCGVGVGGRRVVFLAAMVASSGKA